MIQDLFNKNRLKWGNFRLKNGGISKYYFNMKNLISYPKLLLNLGDKLYYIIKNSNIEYDYICPIPTGAIPIATYISIKYNIPMILPRFDKKNYGMPTNIEGEYQSNKKCIIIEDVITTGGSVNDLITLLDKFKLKTTGVFCIIDRQYGHDISPPVYNLFTKTEIIRIFLNKFIKEKKSKLCFSADMDKKDLFPILNIIGPYIVICKIHFDVLNLTKNETTTLIELSSKYRFLIMEDRKLNDISSIVHKQYKNFSKWADLITVFPNVNSFILKKICGALIVTTMSNNKDFQFIEQASLLAKQNKKYVFGFITQQRIADMKDFVHMTPGISIDKKSIADQVYRHPKDVDTDIFIVGRSLYEKYKGNTLAVKKSAILNYCMKLLNI